MLSTKQSGTRETIDTMAAAAHDPYCKHNILGNGKITHCPPECPAHARWKGQQSDQSSV